MCVHTCTHCTSNTVHVHSLLDVRTCMYNVHLCVAYEVWDYTYIARASLGFFLVHAIAASDERLMYMYHSSSTNL